MDTDYQELKEFIDWYQNFYAWIGDTIGTKFRRSYSVWGYQSVRFIVDEVVTVQLYGEPAANRVAVSAYAGESGTYKAVTRIARGTSREDCERAVQDVIVEAVKKRYDLTSDTHTLW